MKSCGKVRNNDSMAPKKMGQGTINQKINVWEIQSVSKGL